MTFRSDGMERIPLGGDFFYTRIMNDVDMWIGIVLWYDGCAVHEDCRSGLYFYGTPGKTTTWNLLHREPLTIHPSIQQKPCDFHGWIQEGKWVPA